MKESCKDYLSHNKSKSFNEMLFAFIDAKGVKDSVVYKKVDIDRKLFSKIRCSNNYIPRKNVIIKLCFALGLPKNDFNKLLNSAGYSLSSSKFDLVITYCLDNNIYDINIINDYLYTYVNAVL
ncbi:MAG: hypothetical protein IJR82_02520 [Bacilli bacterium]|nr:hypothetical protein [Bacilli bacterium]